jgi:hypothetical protein
MLGAAASWQSLIAKAKSQSLWGFAAEQSEAGRSEKHQSLWRLARVVSDQPVSRTKMLVLWSGTWPVTSWQTMWPRVICKRRHRQQIEYLQPSRVSELCGRRRWGPGASRSSKVRVLAWPSQWGRHDQRLVLFVDSDRLQSLNRGELWITPVALRWWRNNFRFFRLSE